MRLFVCRRINQVDCTGNSPIVSWCGTGKTCGSPYSDPSIESPPKCVVPPSTAEIICANDGTLSIVAPLQSQSGEHAARQDLLYGYMNHDAESIQLYGRIPAKLDEKNGEVRGHWNQRVLTVKQGTFTAPLFARTTYENKLAHHEVPLRYIPASSFPCQAGICKSFRAVWHATTDHK